MDIAALVISILSFAVASIVAFLKWPRVHVQIRPVRTRSGLPLDSPITSETFKLIVLNTGSEAVTISNVGLANLADRYNWLDMEQMDRDGRPAWARLIGPDLPVQIDGHGCVQWIASDDALSTFIHGTKIVGYAHRYRNPWKGLRGPMRDYRSQMITRRGGVE